MPTIPETNFTASCYNFELHPGWGGVGVRTQKGRKSGEKILGLGFSQNIHGQDSFPLGKLLSLSVFLNFCLRGGSVKQVSKLSLGQNKHGQNKLVPILHVPIFLEPLSVER